jgi:hypothetical protein
VARRDPEVKELLDRFVCVRVVEANGLDLSVFQFDFGLTWAVFFMNADRTIYGRYGSRRQADGSEDVSIEGFRKAAEAALELHGGYPGNRASLAGKSAPAPRFATPREYPSLREFPATVDPARGERYNPTCVHCHQVQAAEYAVFRAAKQPVQDELLWSWPMPDALGLALDVKEKATVTSASGSAAKDGFRAGDAIVRLEDQPIISVADVQWILARSKDGATLRAEVLRVGRTEVLSLSLPPGWRRGGDLSWRDAARSAFVPELAATAEPGGLRVTQAGLGLRKDDLILEVDGRRLESFSALIAYVARERKRGERLVVVVRRVGTDLKLDLDLP